MKKESERGLFMGANVPNSFRAVYIAHQSSSRTTKPICRGYIQKCFLTILFYGSDMWPSKINSFLDSELQIQTES